MKILIYSKNYKTVGKSGVGRAMAMQIEALQKMGAEVVLDPSEPHDIVHINTVFPNDLLMSIKSRLKGKKVVYHAHSTEEDFRESFVGSNLLAPLFKRWIMLCYRTGDLILTPTEYSKSLLTGYGIKNRIEVYSNGVNTELFSKTEDKTRAFRKKYGYRESDKVVMAVGLYFKRKGIIDFVKLAKAMPEYKFIWFGYTNPLAVPSEVRRALRLKLPNLRFAGYVDKEILKTAYSGADLFFFPSYEETEGIVVLEALASSIPVLLRYIPVYDGWTENGKNLYKGGNNKQFKRYIKAIVEKKLPDVTAQGLETARDRDLSVQAEKLMEFYRSVLK